MSGWFQIRADILNDVVKPIAIINALVGLDMAMVSANSGPGAT